jgi:hypothetical protein
MGVGSPRVVTAGTPKVADVRVLQRVLVGLERLLPITTA